MQSQETEDVVEEVWKQSVALSFHLPPDKEYVDFGSSTNRAMLEHDISSIMAKLEGQKKGLGLW